MDFFDSDESLIVLLENEEKCEEMFVFEMMLIKLFIYIKVNNKKD